MIQTRRRRPGTIIQGDEPGGNILKTIVNHLRKAGWLMLIPETTQNRSATAEWGQRARSLVVALEGLTPQAVEVLPANPLVIDDFPFRIGRASNKRTSYNDLELPDRQPFQLSRDHITIFEENGRIGVSDLGSTLGAEVDGYRFGGRGRSNGPVFFKGQGGALVLGSPASPYRFRVTVTSQK